MENSLVKNSSSNLDVLYEKCADKKLITSLVVKYQGHAKTATESIISMAEALLEVKEKVENQELSEYDHDYFCEKVKLSKSSSQYRKFIRIGKSAKTLRRYINQLPESISVLYQITTLDEDVFEELIEGNYIQPNLTLEALKAMVGKSKQLSKESQKNDGTKKTQVQVMPLKVDEQSIILNFDKSKISQKTWNLLVEFCVAVEKSGDVEIELSGYESVQQLASEKVIYEESV
jgi:hypothetical protein